AARDVGPDLERVGARMAVVPAVRPAAFGRDHDRARTPLAELRLVAGVRELVVVRAKRVEKEGEAVSTGGPWLGGHVDRVWLEPASEFALAVGGLPAGGVVARALLALEVARQDPVHGPGR